MLYKVLNAILQVSSGTGQAPPGTRRRSGGDRLTLAAAAATGWIHYFLNFYLAIKEPSIIVSLLFSLSLSSKWVVP